MNRPFYHYVSYARFIEYGNYRRKKKHKCKLFKFNDESKASFMQLEIVCTVHLES